MTALPSLQPLPIDEHLPEIIRALKSFGSVVVQAEPGAGKTTRVPPAILRDGGLGGGDVCVLEPRRIAARLTAARVAMESGCQLGGLVGYQVRFEEKVSAATRLRFMTEGILVRRLKDDPCLKGTAAVVLDEVHERHLDTDAALALCRRLQKSSRPDLKLVVMSATMDAEAFSRFLGGSPVVRVPGRTYPVEVEHLKFPDPRPLEDQVASAFLRILREDGDGGDILAFLPGAGEIRRAADKCQGLADSAGVDIRILHGDLSAEEQDRAVRDGGRKLILATNIAESSITLPGVTWVIDSGLARVARSDPFTGIPSLQVEKVPKSSAIQRAGRAGRVQGGRCLRLYDRHDFDVREENAVPEILRMDLSPTALLVHGMGVRSMADLDWPDAPPEKSVVAAEELLHGLGALDGEGELTPTGQKMLGLPVHPRLARMMVEASRRGAGTSGALAAAILSEKQMRQARVQDFRGVRGPRLSDGRATVASDVFDAMETFEAVAESRFSPAMLRSFDLSAQSVRAVDRSFQKLRRMVPADGKGLTPEGREEAMLVSILAGHPDRVAMKRHTPAVQGKSTGAESGRAKGAQSPEFTLCGGGTAVLSEDSCVRSSDLVVAVDMEERGRAAQKSLTIRSASEVKPEWLIDLFEDAIREEEETFWNDRLQRAEGRSRLCFGRLVLSESPAVPSDLAASAVLESAALGAGISRFIPADRIQALRVRSALVRTHFPELAVEEVSDESLASFLKGQCQGRKSFRELEEAGLEEEAKALFLGAAAHKVDRLFPGHVELPGGRKVTVHYEPDQPPWVESRLQDFFGQRTTPRIADGRIPLVVHLLAPSGRPVQVTQDLQGFWDRHYPELRNALARRYPKHSWPQDPATAQPPAPRRR